MESEYVLSLRLIFALLCLLLIWEEHYYRKGLLNIKWCTMRNKQCRSKEVTQQGVPLEENNRDWK